MSQTAPSGPNPVVTFLKERWLAVVLVALALLFIVQNPDDVRFDFLWLSFTAPLWLMLTLTVLAGVVVGWIAKGRRSRSSD